MAGGIVASVVTPHTPRIGIEAKAPPFLRGAIEGSRALGAALLALKPDLFVVNSTHWITTFPWYATCQARHKGFCVADEAPDLIPGVPYDRPGDPEFGRALVDEIAAAGLPAGRNESEHFKWDYGSFVPLQYIDPAGRVPVVLVGTCLMATLDECAKVGATIRCVAARTGRRTVFIASTALAHKILRGPELWPPPEHMEADRRFIDMLCAGRIAEAKSCLPAYAREVVAEMGGRPLAVMLGCLDEGEDRAYAGREFGPYCQSSGSGNISVAVSPA
ncbi:MAG: extradiol ring-cleavage dioxygenase [Rhodospirillales bacterium]|nr:extradiol ring-cleavage dioxygenase [Rhodospirillales bacterium]